MKENLQTDAKGAQEKWQTLAARVLKVELKRRDISYQDLQERLEELGIEESYAGISNKINRGKFSFAFFLQCMRAIKAAQVSLPEYTD